MDREFNDKLGEVENIINQGKKHLLSHMWLVDRDALMDALQEMRVAVPAAIQDANNININRSRILGDAKRFADNTLAEATARARTLQQDAEARARQILEEADHYAAQTRADAEANAHDIIEEAERRAEALMEQTEVMRRAEVKAREITEEATEHGNAIYQDALNRTEDMLAAAEQVFAERTSELRRFRSEIDQYR